MILALGVIIAALVLAVVGLTIWLAKSRERAIQAETAAKTLLKGQERIHEANKIMSEPVAHEPSWIRRTRDRLRDDSNLP